MAQNQNYTGNLNIIEAIINLSRSWNRPIGLLVALVLELSLLLLFGEKLNVEGVSFTLKTVAIVVLLIATVMIWLLSSKRLLFRNNRRIVLIILVAVLCSLWYCYRCYPKYIANSPADFPYVHLLGTVNVFIIVVLMGLLLYNCLSNKKTLFVVFAVANGSIALENKLKETIRNVLSSIEEDVNSIRLELLPFGTVKSAKQAERFIKRSFTSADAVIFATIIEETEGDHIEYLFDKFTSRINERRFPDNEIDNRIDLGVVTTHSRSKTWNYINAGNDNCTRTRVILNNLKNMLQMYVGGILLMKHRFKDALPLMELSLNKELGNKDTYDLASQLYTYSILSTAKEFENDQQDYDNALCLLQQCAARVPASVSHPGYNKAMARVMFYKGNLKSSIDYTKRFKDLKGHEWGYELNMGFYAIYGKVVHEFVRRYKRLLKYQVREKSEIDFAIHFLEYQKKNSEDPKYSILLGVAIAYLFIYLKRSKAKRLISKINYSSLQVEEIQDLNKLKEIILKDDRFPQVDEKQPKLKVS